MSKEVIALVSPVLLYGEINLICILTFGMLAWKVNRSMFLQSHRFYFRLVALSAIALFGSDFLWIFSENGYWLPSRSLNWLLNGVYYVCMTLLGYCWFLYSESVQNPTRAKSKGYLFLTALPLLLITLLVLISTKTGWLFYIDEGNHYHRGPLFLLQSVICYGYIFATAIRAQKLSNETRDYYETAELGNSYSASSGTPIVLLGDLFGTDISQAYGIIASNEQEESRPDGKFKLLTSDVGGGEQSSGVFLNTKGEVVGFIIPESSSGSSSAICAYPISDIKKVIENLSNGTPVPYIGIYGIDVSTEMAKEQGLKEGIYVSRTALDSPAMAAGLQSGDIIQEVDGQSIRTLNAFRASLFNHAEGDVVEIKVQRPGKESYLSVTCTVTIGSLTQQ